jgi:polyhydroxyalkanoate synthesis repressor PhaR
MATSPEPAIIKRYGDRRLDHPGMGSYATLQDLAAMVEDDEDFVACEARTGEDITRSIFKQIIFERAKHG